MKLFVSSVVTNRAFLAWEWIALDVVTINGKQCLVKAEDHNEVAQTPGDGSLKFENVANLKNGTPGSWEEIKLSNGQVVYATGFTRLYVERL